MALNTEQELVSFIQQIMGASYNKLSDDSFKAACKLAQMELHWNLPLVHSDKEYWLIERSKRYVIYILLTESAHKFQYKKIFLQQRFANYLKLLELMDKQFAAALEDSPDLFDTGTWPNLCYYISVGFQYDFDGEDITFLGR